MPGPTGYEICREIKSSSRPIPVLLLAGAFEAFDHNLARECEADGCLMKPFESRTLLERVESLLADPESFEGEARDIPEEDDALEPPLDDPGEGEAAEMSKGHGSGEGQSATGGLAPEALEAIVLEVVQRMSTDVVREIAREVVPQVAQELVRQRIQELEGDDS